VTQASAYRRAVVTPALVALGLGGPSPYVAPRHAGEPDTLTAAYDVAGVHVLHRIHSGSSIVAVRLYLLGGCRQLTAHTAGIEALLLEASADGTARFPGRQVTRVMQSTGAEFYVEPELDWTVVGFTGLVADLDSAWSVLADRITHPTLSEGAVTQARARLQTQARRRYTQPDARIHVIAMQGLFHDHPYSLDPGGTEVSLNALRGDDVRAYLREQMVTSRMLLAVVGDVTRARVESLVTPTLGQLPRGDYHWSLPSPPERRRAAWLIEHRQTPTTYLLGLFAGPLPTSQRYWSFRVATELLSSELHYAIRTERSLSYAAYAPFLDHAIPVGGIYASTPKPDQVFPLMLHQIERLEEQSVDRFSLTRFVSNFTFDYLAENATAANQADFLARAELYLGSYRKGDEFLKRLRNVSPSDVSSVAAQYMTAIQYAYLGDTTRMRGNW
jgi:zinc protease